MKRKQVKTNRNKQTTKKTNSYSILGSLKKIISDKCE